MVNVVLEIIEQFVGCGIALVKVAGEGALKNFVEPIIDALIERAKIRDGHAQHVIARFFSGVAFEHISAQEEVTENDAGGEEIGAFVGDLEIGLLRAHVIGFASNDFAFVIDQKAFGLGDAEVSQFYVAFEGDHDVFEAYVAMDNAKGFAIFVGFGVGIGQTPGDAADDKDSEFLRQNAAFVRKLLGKLFEVDPANELHRDEKDAARFAEVISLNDVGVDEVGDELGFADKIFDELFLVGVVLADDFDGDAFDEVARSMLFGFVNDAHSAFENFADNVVAEFVLDGEERHELMVIKLIAKSSGQRGVEVLNR